MLLVTLPALALARAGPEANPKPKAQTDEYTNSNNYDYGTDYGEESYGKIIKLAFKIKNILFYFYFLKEMKIKQLMEMDKKKMRKKQQQPHLKQGK